MRLCTDKTPPDTPVILKPWNQTAEAGQNNFTLIFLTKNADIYTFWRNEAMIDTKEGSNYNNQLDGILRIGKVTESEEGWIMIKALNSRSRKIAKAFVYLSVQISESKLPFSTTPVTYHTSASIVNKTISPGTISLEKVVTSSSGGTSTTMQSNSDTTSTTKSAGTNTDVTVYIVIGVAIGALILVVIGLCIYKKKKRNRNWECPSEEPGKQARDEQIKEHTIAVLNKIDGTDKLILEVLEKRLESSENTVQPPG
jgi:hypothetical protein